MSTLGFKRKNIIAVVVAVLMLASGLCVYQSQAAGYIDTDADVTITAIINPQNDSSEFAQKYRGDLEIEIYKIASLDTVGQPTVTDEFKDAGIDFNALNATTNDTKTKILEPAANYVKDNHDSLAAHVNTISGTVTADGFKSQVTIQKGAGIYLYYVAKSVQDQENDYIFTPAIFYAPTSEYVLTGQGSDTWQYEAEIFPKAQAKPRFGNLEIVKTLKTFNKSLGKASFVFEVEGKDSNDKTVFSNVYTMSFDGANKSESIIIDKIPAGTICYVTEVYTGASYTEVAVPVENASEKGVTIKANDTVSVEFVNDYDERIEVGGVSVENHFSQNKTQIDGVDKYEYNWDGNNLENSN